MTQQVLYQYLGTNGSILSPVHLEDAYYVRKLHIFADEGKQLTKNNKDFITSIIIPEEELDQWIEVNID